MNNFDAPYKSLGIRLKALRTARKRSVAEVSGAVEIDEPKLTRFETGSERPSKDILMLLINYFDINEDEAASVWQLAGYEMPRFDQDDEEGDDSERQEFIKEALKHGHTTVMMMAFDPRVMYSDGVDITANLQGMVLNFTQTAPDGSRAPITRIGISYEQANALYEILHKTLEQAKSMRAPKQLPPKTDRNDSQKES